MAFLSPIVTFLDPIAAFSCKIFFISHHNRLRGPIVAFFKPYSDVFGPYSGVFGKSGTFLYSSETVFLSKLFPKLMVMGHFCQFSASSLILCVCKNLKLEWPNM